MTKKLTQQELEYTYKHETVIVRDEYGKFKGVRPKTKEEMEQKEPINTDDPAGDFTGAGTIEDNIINGR